MDDLMQGKETFIGICARCGREGLKRHMVTLFIKANGRSPMRKLCHLCPDCLPVLLDYLEVSMPQ